MTRIFSEFEPHLERNIGAIIICAVSHRHELPVLDQPRTAKKPWQKSPIFFAF
jgi:hypothetical protein